MKDAPSTRDLQVPETISNELISWFRDLLGDDFQSKNFKPMNLIGLNVTDGTCERNVRGSRFNHANATLVLDLIRHLTIHDALPESFAIITPYAEQRACYVEGLMSLSDVMGRRLESIVRVATVDSMQGHEADYLVLDWVVTNPEDLGFTRDNKRANVALTRGPKCVISVLNTSIMESKLLKWKDTESPELLAYWEDLANRRRTVDLKTGDIPDRTFEIPEQNPKQVTEATLKQDAVETTSN